MKEKRRSRNKSGTRSVNSYWKLLVVIAVCISGYIGGEIGFYLFAMTCLCLIFLLRDPVRLTNGNLVYPRIYDEKQ